MKPYNLRYLAAKVLHEVTKGYSLADLLPSYLNKLTDARDRALVQAIVFDVCRFYPRLNFILNRFLDKPLKEKDSDIHTLLLVGLSQLMEMRLPPHAVLAETVDAATHFKKPWAKGLVNAILRKCLNSKDEILHAINQDEVAFYAHPFWWIDKLKAAWGADSKAVLLANNEHPPMALRVNQRRLSREAYLTLLAENNIACEIIPETAQGIILKTPLPVEKIPGFLEGLVSVQDGAAQLAAPLMNVKPTHHVLDACASPGGKLTHLFEQAADLSVVAVEKEKTRLDAISENLTRLFHGKAMVRLHVEDANQVEKWWDGKPFDRILLDAPCSASGVVRRHPDIKLLRRREDISALVVRQKELLNSLWPLLRSGGLLLYATCSIFPEENADLLMDFMSQHPHAREQKIKADWGIACKIGRQILPGMHHMDGFYYALIYKI